MNIHAVSDTHSRHGVIKLTGGDLLMHAGDMTGNGSQMAIFQFMTWMELQPYTYKVAIPGNHDWDLIPSDTEILVTHGPPKDILDMCVFPNGTDREGVGCEDLLSQIMRIPTIKLHVFGHIHEGKGHTYKYGKTFVNASSLDQLYRPVPGTPTRIVRDSEGSYLVED